MIADLPTAGDLAGGGIIGGVVVAAAWLINWFRSAATDGENLADRRINSLMVEFEAHRQRALATQATFTAELTAVQSELTEARAQLRACRAESHSILLRLDELTAEIAVLKGDG